MLHKINAIPRICEEDLSDLMISAAPVDGMLPLGAGTTPAFGNHTAGTAPTYIAV